MKPKIRLLFYSLTGGFFLLFDQLLKYIAYNNQDISFSILEKYVGWEFLGNTGVAFSLPFPNIILIIFTPLVILGLFIFLTKQKNVSLISLGILLIIAGAISNLIDRVLFEITIDYIRIFTSVINLADVMIVMGATLLVISESKKKRRETPLD